METITIKSDYKYLFNAYETLAVTDKGMIRTRCIQLDRETAHRWADEDNKRVPFYDSEFCCYVYHVIVNQITICAR